MKHVACSKCGYKHGDLYCPKCGGHRLTRRRGDDRRSVTIQFRVNPVELSTLKTRTDSEDFTSLSEMIRVILGLGP